MKNFTKLVLVVISLAISVVINAQTTGTVFRDLNGNGTRQTSAPNEPLVKGIIVNAYNSSDALIASYTTTTAGTFSIPLTGSTYNGTPGSNTGSVANALAVRLEFVIPASGACGLNPNIDYSSGNGSTVGSSVRFVTGGTTAITYAIHSPSDFVSTTNPMVYMSRHTNGNPLGGGTSGTANWFVGFPYNTTGTGAPTLALNGTTIGATWGVAYSRQAGKVFTSAFLKRHSGLGVLGSGGIYLLTPTATSFTVVNFYDMDAVANGGAYRTRADAAAAPPAYGSGTSYSLTGSNTIINYLGSIDAASGKPVGMGVIGTNLNRGLPASNTLENWDPAAFDQVGKVGLGDLEISDDGKFLFSINLYDRKVYRLELNNAYNPTSVVAVTSYALPATTVTNGVLRPFGAKFYRGKLYVGAVATAENAGTAANLRAYVFELNNASTTPAFTATPVVNYALNYAKGSAMTWTGPYGLQWYPWSNNTTTTVGTGTNRTYPTPILSNIEFDDRGDMIMSFFDRGGHQWSEDNYQDLAVSTTLMRYAVGGDVLIAGSNCNGTFSLENNGAYTSANGTSYNSGAVNNEGPGTSEFFKGDNFGTTHSETSIGGLGFLPGSGELFFGTMDPLAINSGGVKRLSMATGQEVASSGYQLAGGSIAGFGKAISLGDIEFFGTQAPVEIGNRLWNDANGNGIQDAGETGIQNVSLELYADFNSDGIPDGAVLGTTTTSPAGEWYFNNSNIADGDPGTAGNQPGLKYGAGYIVRVGAADWNGSSGTGLVDLAGLQLTRKYKIGNGQTGLSDSDGELSTGATSFPQIMLTAGKAGENNHNLDFGFKPLASIGDKVWRDDNKNAAQDTGEPGVSGITITLFRPGFGLDGIAATADDALPIGNTVTDSYGNYLFDNLVAGNYQVLVNLPANYQFTTQSNTVDNTDGVATKDKGSDVNATTGLSYSVALSVGELERNIDAGIIFNQPASVSSIGDKVWYDIDGGGDQDANEPGVSNVTVTLYKETAPASGIYVVYATTVTDVNGFYLFNNLPNNTNYKVSITPPAGTQLTTSTGTTAGNATTDSDLDPATRLSAVVNIPPAGAQITGIDAGLILQLTTKASLGDRVWYDNNRDGDQDAGEPGIAGVTVQLLDGSSNVLATTTTDAFGMYIFTNLNPGLYRINFGAVAGMQRTAKDATGGAIADITDSDADPTTGKTQGYTLNAGGKNMSVDAGYYSTQPAINVGAIGDRVWIDNDGNGVQDAGEPSVAGVTVTLYNNAGTVIATATTDINGNYLFPGLTPGNYSVGFSNIPAGFGFSGQNKGGNSATDGDPNPATGRTQTVTVTGGTTNITIDAGIRQGLPSGLGSLGNKVFIDLPGGVMGQQEAGELGVSGVTVQLYLDANGDGSIAGAEQTAIATTTTNALGEYLFAGLNGGTYQVGFSNLPGSYSLTVKDAAGISDDEDSDGNPVNTAVNGNPATAGKSYTDLISLAQGEDNLSVDLGLATPANTNSLGNYVWFDANSNGIQDAAENGVPGVMVTLYNNAGTAIAVTTTDANGQYLFAGLADGNYSVGFVNYPSGFDLTLKSATNDLTGSDADRTSGRTATVTLNFAAGGTNRDNRSLDAGLITVRSALGDKVWSDLNNNGTQDVGEYGVPGVTVSLFRPGFGLDGIAGNGDDALSVASMITDGKGNYFFSNLVPGDYQVEFSTIPTGMLFTQQNTAGDNQNNTNSDAVPANANGRTGTITLSAGETDLTIDAGLTVPRPATIGNFVWDDFNANGIQDATEPGIGGILVTLYNSVNQPIGSSVTDGNGYWQITNIPAGTGYYVIFSPNLPAFNTTVTPGSNPAWTTQNLGANGTGAIDSGTESDVDSDVTATGANAGRTAAFNIVSGNNFPNIDAGIVNWASGNVLPIQLVSFIAQPQAGSVKLTWQVATETNVATYQVLYSTNGINFTAIGSQPATGSHNYSQLHASPQQGLNYYRLKVIDIDGSVTYSEIRKVNFGKAADNIEMYPVPANTYVNITFSSSMINKPATVSILSIDGKLVLQQTIQALSQTETINLSRLSAGKYIVRLVVNNEVINRQIEVIR